MLLSLIFSYSSIAEIVNKAVNFTYKIRMMKVHF